MQTKQLGARHLGNKRFGSQRAQVREPSQTMIAATARIHKLTVVTRNVPEYSGLDCSECRARSPVPVDYETKDSSISSSAQ